jgi:hypothetical protein
MTFVSRFSAYLNDRILVNQFAFSLVTQNVRGYSVKQI